MAFTGDPRVIRQEVDKSSRVPGAAGVFGAICVPALKGPVNTPTLVTSDADFLRRFTPNETITVGMSTAHFSALAFLQKSSSLYVVRAANSALYGGCAFVDKDAVGNNTAWAAGEADPTSFTFGADDLFVLYGSSEGAFANDIKVKIYNYTESPDVVKESGAFMIEVYKSSNMNVALERWVVSIVDGAKDGFGNDMYLENKLLGSNYIRGFVNPAADTALLPKEDSTGIALASGSDGSAVTDTEMIAAVDTLANKDAYAITCIMDGGWATTAFQTQINTVCSNRQDCVGILSTPYADETTATPVTDLIDYRKTDLNMNSSFSTMYTPHVKIYDKFNGREIYVAPDGYVGAQLSETANNQELWFPVAGPRRGVLNVLDVRQKFNSTERGLLYDAGVNTLKFKAGQGITIWGQKTLLTRPSALDRLNVRLLLIAIGEPINTFLEDFLMELNLEETRTDIVRGINDFMESIKSRNGVTDYQVVCDGTNNTAQDIDNYQLNVDLFIQPTKSIEYIRFQVVVTRTGVTFNA